MMRKQQGFTLIEILVSVFLVGMIAATAYLGLNQITRNNQAALEIDARLREIRRAWYVVSRDITFMVARPVREATLGSPVPALLADNQSNFALTFTQDGRRNPGNLARSNLQRVAYLVDDGKLKRLAWPVLDPAQDSLPQETVVLDELRGIELRYLDDQNNWHDQWPPANIQAVDRDAYMPIAVEFTMTLEDFGRIERLFELATVNR